MTYAVLPAGEAFWRPSNQMGVLNTDLGRQLGADTHGARFWRLRPGQASTKPRHYKTVELYVVIEGRAFLPPDTARWLALFFFVFAAVDFWFPRMLKKKWEEAVAQQRAAARRDEGGGMRDEGKTGAG